MFHYSMTVRGGHFNGEGKFVAAAGNPPLVQGDGTTMNEAANVCLVRAAEKAGWTAVIYGAAEIKDEVKGTVLYITSRSE